MLVLENESFWVVLDSLGVAFSLIGPYLVISG